MDKIIGFLVVVFLLFVLGGPVGALVGGGMLFWALIAIGCWLVLTLVGFGIIGFLLLIGGITFWLTTFIFTKIA